MTPCDTKLQNSARTFSEELRDNSKYRTVFSVDVEPSVVHAPSSQDAAQAPDARDLRTDFPCRGRVVIRIHCVRNRLADPDGMCVKWIIDSMVAAGVLRDDSCQFIASSPIVTQERGDEETTVVSVEEAETGDNT
jgi:hypothetical protein